MSKKLKDGVYKAQTNSDKITYFVDVDHRKRLYGKSKYGTFKRLFRGIIDIMKVIKIIRKFKKDASVL